MNSVKSRETPLDDREVINSKFFFKQLANEYYDMDLLSNSIIDSKKKDEARLLSKDFRSTLRELDNTASDGSLNKHIIDADKVISKEFKDFFDLLSDVPDEL